MCSALTVPGLARKDALAHIELLRRIDWENTSLGPISTWSQALQSAVGMCLASPFPVLLAWGPDLVMLYNYAYGENISTVKHPKIMGMPYREAWPEVWQYLIAPTGSAMSGTSVYAQDVKMFLRRGGLDLQECYYSWAMVPILGEDQEIAGIYIPNFDTTASIIIERRIRLLREASQAFSVNSSIQSFFTKVCSAIQETPDDLPLVAIYDCSAADEERDNSIDNSTTEGISTSHAGSECGKGQNRNTEQADRNMESETIPSSAFVRAAIANVDPESKVFPAVIPAMSPNEDAETIGCKYELLSTFRRLERDHKQIVMQKEDLQTFANELDKTKSGDQIETLVLIPLMTVDHALRAIAIVGLNPRMKFDTDYQVFLDLFGAQLSHGITSVRLVNEEIRRAKFMAALIKRKNEELHQLLAARTDELRSSELRFSTMTAISPAGIWRANPDGEITFANEAWWRISRHPKELGANAFIQSVHEEDVPAAVAMWEKALTSRTPVPPMEFRWKAQPGQTSERWCYAVSSPELDAYGNIVSITGALTDITDNKMMMMYEKQRAEEAIALRTAQERFVDMTSHELRNPLSAIILSADSSAERLSATSANALPADHVEDVKDTLEDLKIISHCCTHMSRLIDDILTLSKIDNSFLVVTPIPSRPTEFVRETLSVFKAEMLSKDIKCDLDIKPSFATLNVDWLLTDPSRVNQLLINLLTNAIKFTAPGSDRHIRVLLDVAASRPVLAGGSASGVTERTEGGSPAGTPIEDPETVFLCVSVCDTGRGLTADEAAGLFKRFKQASAMTHISYGGSGLGLFICKRLAELLGGDIGVESERGKGSTFSFYVPAKRCSSPQSGKTPLPGTMPLVWNTASTENSQTSLVQRKDTDEHSTSGSASQVQQALHVLIVEDNLVNQSLLKRLLSKQGCICSVANHGQEAIDMIRSTLYADPDGSRRYDCVLMDIEMPVLGGMAAIRILRQMQANKEIQGHVPILACTANARDEQIQAMEAAGFDGTVSKPFRIPVIMQRMRDLIIHLAARGLGPPN